MSGAFLDLPLYVEETCQLFSTPTSPPNKEQKAFWLQFQEQGRPQVFGNKLKQVAELQQAAKLAMEGLCKVLWPRDPLPTSFFGLVPLL